MIEINKLKIKLRGDFSKYIRPLVIKDKCDICGNNEKLEVHHTIQFSKLLYETLKELNLEEREFFKDNEEKLIRNIMLGKQVNPKISITMCCKCHDKTHKNIGMLNPYLNHLNSINKKRIRKRSKKDMLWKMLNDYCDSNFKIIGKEEKDILANKINYKDSNNKTLKSIGKLNEYLINNDIGFRIIEGRNKLSRYWIIKNIDIKNKDRKKE